MLNRLTKGNMMNKETLAKNTYIESLTYDYALPQSWVNETKFRTFEFIWAYPDDSLYGLPLPLTISALSKLVEHYHHQNNSEMMNAIVQTMSKYLK